MVHLPPNSGGRLFFGDVSDYSIPVLLDAFLGQRHARQLRQLSWIQKQVRWGNFWQMGGQWIVFTPSLPFEVLDRGSGMDLGIVPLQKSVLR